MTITGFRVNTDNANARLCVIVLPDGSYYTDPTDHVNAWPRYVANAIARNVAMKRKCITIVKHMPPGDYTVANEVVQQEVIDTESPFDRIINYVDTLKGKALTAVLVQHNLPKGGDPVASKRQRLIDHLYRKCDCNK